LLHPLTAGIGTKLPFAAFKNYVRFLGYSGREMLALRLSHFDPERTKRHARPNRFLPMDEFIQ
jgi:hypothetical protein